MEDKLLAFGACNAYIWWRFDRIRGRHRARLAACLHGCMGAAAMPVMLNISKTCSCIDRRWIKYESQVLTIHVWSAGCGCIGDLGKHWLCVLRKGTISLSSDVKLPTSHCGPVIFTIYREHFLIFSGDNGGLECTSCQLWIEIESTWLNCHVEV